MVQIGDAIAGEAGVGSASPRRRAAPDRRLEDWIAANLDIETERPATNLWTQLVGNLPAARRVKREGGSERGLKSKGCWERFDIVYKRGLTIVRLTEPSLARRADINGLAEDWVDLIEAGNHRLILNFAKVERLGSWIVAAVVEAHRRCLAVEGGKLKICGLAPELAEIFRIIGMGRQIFLCPDEQTAVDGPWPAPAKPRGLPIDILEALIGESALPPLRGGAPADESGAPAASGFDWDDDDPAARIKCEVIEETLVVTPVLTELDGEEANEALRRRLLELAEEPLPRRVVINLEFAARLSRQTIGVLVAHQLRLNRAGGAIRICGAHPRIIAMLDQVRLTMLVDCFPNLDEAVLTSWNHHEG